ncbi:MAG: glycosyl hydrolase [Gammaproteobacteria bacterium]|nr:glycosyl hydrolase [Gammaproteobacteria bacterium]
MNLDLFKGFLLVLSASSVLACASGRIPIETNNQIEEMVAKINFDTDPNFVYEYEKTKFVPPHGKTLLIMGQTVDGITEYLDSFPDQPVPGGWSAYWGITEFEGITESHRSNIGATQNHQMLVDRFPNTVLHSAMWMVGTWGVAKDTGSGKYDHVVRKFSQWAKTTDRPIYLRIGYEFDGPHNALEPKEYVRAYRRIVDIMRSEGVTNVAFVWHSYAAPRFKGYSLSTWYPGNDYVDWVGISVFFQPYDGTELGPDGDLVLNFARTHKKPVMIAEANPVRGIEQEGIETWNQWFVNFFSLAYNKNVKAISFINEDWNRLDIEGIDDWEDARLYNNKKISTAWFKETQKNRYLKQSPELFQQLGYARKNSP